MERIDPDIEGVIFLKGVTVNLSQDKNIEACIHFAKVQRNSYGFIMRVFVHESGWSNEYLKDVNNFSRENTNYLGDLYVYATTSPVVPLAERLTMPLDMPKAEDQGPYETFITINKTDKIQNKKNIDLILVLLARGGKLMPSSCFEFSDVYIKSTTKYLS